MAGALKVRVATAPDQWVTVGGAPKDAIHVGASPPADADVELWWDSDAPAAYLPTPVDYSVEAVNVARYGFTRSAVVAALDDAEARGEGSIVYFPAGVYELDTGISLSGYSVQLRGDGATQIGASTLGGTVFKASTQSGPVLDFTGWLSPDSFRGAVTHSGFHVVGSNVADATKNNAGIRVASIGATTFADICIRETGGPCLDGTAVVGGGIYMCNFERCVFMTPVSAKVNDVPYVRLSASNCNRFRGCGLRSTLASADVGASGAVTLTDNGSFGPTSNLFDGWWIEYLHVPTNGTIFHIAGSANSLNDFQFIDCSKETSATGTSYIRLAVPAVDNNGGNQVTGLIPGKGSVAATDIDTGVDIRQNRNSVRGVKGFRGANVTLAVGVANCDVELSGAQSGASDPAVVDNSGVATNRYADHYLRTSNEGGYRVTSAVSGAMQLLHNTADTQGHLNLGTSGVRVQAVGTILYDTADVVVFRNIAQSGPPTITIGTAATAPQIITGSIAPESNYTAPPGSLYLRTGGGAGTSFYVKESGTGGTGWIGK